ncbi:MAG: murein biosynthesis integral membrane protein MurJ [Anaerolineae bacterium]|nr:murein biosynthesis integral membrane protein MurJ [Thermoflexales bacterium]MDW8395251.1 murein biosynthesis integral membrane protein MurJ [Anaerolineae bacterium]
MRVSLARSALVISALYLLSNVVGFFARLLINARFGAGAEQDAFRAAFVIPDLLFNVFAGGALVSAFIPVYVARLTHDQARFAWRLAQATALVVVGAVAVLSVIAALLAPWLIRTLVARAFDPAQAMLAAALMRVMLVATVIFSASGLLMGVLQSNQHFFAPALAPSLYQFGMILGATVLSEVGIFGLAWGVVVGAGLHLGVQLPIAVQLWRHLPRGGSGVATRAVWSDLRQVLRLMPPRMIGLGAVQVNQLVNTTLASAVLGGVSAFNNAFAILLLPIAAIGQAAGTALFPALSAHAARGEHALLAQALTRALGAVVLLSLPGAVGLIVLGEPLIRLLFERGAFDARATHWVAFALAWLALGLPAHVGLELVTRAFYALKDSTTPALIAVLSVILNVALSAVLFGWFAEMGVPAIGGLGLANALATTAEVVALYALLARRLPALSLRPLGVALVKSGVASVAMSALLLLWRASVGEAALPTLAALVIGGVAYGSVLLLVRSEEARSVVNKARHLLQQRAG